MAMAYKIDVLAALKEKGWSAYKLRKERELGESTIQKLRDRKPISWENVETLCRLLKCQPSDILEYVEESAE